MTLPYNTALTYCEIESLTLRRHNFQQKSFKQICHTGNCLHDLLPPECDPSVSLWLRHPTVYPVPQIRTKWYCSFINYSLKSYQWQLFMFMIVSFYFIIYLICMLYILCFCCHAILTYIVQLYLCSHVYYHFIIIIIIIIYFVPHWQVAKKVITVHKAVDKCETGLSGLKKALIVTLNSLPKALLLLRQPDWFYFPGFIFLVPAHQVSPGHSPGGLWKWL